MNMDTPLQKRIRRHVVGRELDFFAVTAPGLEALCRDELDALPLSVKNAAAVSGGVEFRGRLHDGYLANLCLRTAGRILMRIAMFRAVHFGELEKKLADIPWELYLMPGALPEVSVSLSHSRLYHSDAVAERVQKAVSTRLPAMSPEPIPETASGSRRIFVRATDDRFVLSMDSSGDNLYKRGIKQHGGRAPLRETLAAAALMLAGFDPDEPLIDPMCGTGTFSLEAALMASRISPGSFRNFAFTGWPSFQTARWEHMRQQTRKEWRIPEIPVIFASDRDRSACEALGKNLVQSGLDKAVQVNCQDFFDVLPKDITEHQGMVSINPPYGIRIGTRRESGQLFYAICRHLEAHYKGWKIAMIAPDRTLALNIPFAAVNAHPIRHGGLNLTLLAGRIG